MTVREYLVPDSVPAALEVLATHGGGVTVMAGGTLLMPAFTEGTLLPERVMSLRRVGLDGIERAGDELVIGAAVTLTRLAEQADVPLLREAALHTASWSVRNLATVGGNLFAPSPLGEVAVALLAMGARVRLAGASGAREVSIDDFYADAKTGRPALAPGELVTHVVVPVSDRATAFMKFARTQAHSPAVVTVAVSFARQDGRVADARVALGAAGPRPMRIPAAEAALNGTRLEPDAIAAAASAAERDCTPADDAVASAWYRRRMVGVFVRRALEQLA